MLQKKYYFYKIKEILTVQPEKILLRISVSVRQPRKKVIQTIPPPKMRHFTVNLYMNAIGAFLFLVMGICLIVGFVMNQSIVEELQQVKILPLLIVHHDD